jgi:hypothetical protein
MFAPDVSIDGDNAALPQYSYREMVRRNFNKDCADLDQSILELYVCDGDFYAVFLRTKVSTSCRFEAVLKHAFDRLSTYDAP